MLISPEYAALNTILHETDPTYGARAYRFSEFIAWRANTEGYRTILDYGCGKGTLSLMLVEQHSGNFTVTNYDPAIPSFSVQPEPADFVVCLDVLEHVEPDCLDDVLAELHRLTLKEALFVISLHRSSKTLADGRNAHLIVESHEWWRDKVGRYYTITDSTLREPIEVRLLLKPKES